VNVEIGVVFFGRYSINGEHRGRSKEFVILLLQRHFMVFDILIEILKYEVLVNYSAPKAGRPETARAGGEAHFQRQ